jgi:hypothetical protein
LGINPQQRRREDEVGRVGVPDVHGSGTASRHSGLLGWRSSPPSLLLPLLFSFFLQWTGVKSPWPQWTGRRLGIGFL